MALLFYAHTGEGTSSEAGGEERTIFPRIGWFHSKFAFDMELTANKKRQVKSSKGYVRFCIGAMQKFSIRKRYDTSLLVPWGNLVCSIFVKVSTLYCYKIHFIQKNLNSDAMQQPPWIRFPTPLPPTCGTGGHGILCASTSVNVDGFGGLLVAIFVVLCRNKSDRRHHKSTSRKSSGPDICSGKSVPL